MNLGEGYAYVLQALGKDQWGGYVTPKIFNLSLLVANQSYFNNFVKVFEANNTIAADIAPFVKTLGDNEYEALPIDSYGYMQLPPDFSRHVRSHVYEYKNEGCETAKKMRIMVDVLTNDVFNGRLTRSGKMLGANKKYPFATLQNDKMYIQPPVYDRCVFTYLRNPIRPFFDYDIVNGEIVYLPPNSTHTTNNPLPIGTPSLSVELEWPEQTHEDFFETIVRYLSINQKSVFNLETLDIQKP